jgi:hypothetical protein
MMYGGRNMDRTKGRNKDGPIVGGPDQRSGQGPDEGPDEGEQCVEDRYPR